MRLVSIVVTLMAAGSTAGGIYLGTPTITHPEVAFVGAFCSGVAVGPQTVLTSWHCNNATYVAINGYARRNHTVVQLGGIDLAYVCLKAAQTMTVASATTTAVKDGDEVTVVGYGEREKLTYDEMRTKRSTLDEKLKDSRFDVSILFATVAAGGGGLLRAGTSKIATVSARTTLAPNPAVPCMGDSGGPVYRAGTKNLIGIIDEYPSPLSTAVCGGSMHYIDMTTRTNLITQAKTVCGDP